MSVEALQSDKRRKNESLMLSIREDAQWSGALLQACKDDMAKGRMDQGRKAEEMGSELDRVTLSSRFPVVQGTLPETFPYRQIFASRFACCARDAARWNAEGATMRRFLAVG